MSKPKIDRKKFYTLYEIANADLFETGLKTFSAKKNKSRTIIMGDKFTRNHLKAMVIADKEVKGRKKYAIQGENIIKWLANKDCGPR